MGGDSEIGERKKFRAGTCLGAPLNMLANCYRNHIVSTKWKDNLFTSAIYLFSKHFWQVYKFLDIDYGHLMLYNQMSGRK